MLLVDLPWITVFAKSMYSEGIGHLTAPNASIPAAVAFYLIYVYDLTNLATLRDWPLRVTLVDMTWGPIVSGVSTAAGKYVYDRMV